MYNVIEDCSPYYVKFYHESLPKIVNYIKNKKYVINEDWKTSIAVLGRYQFDINASQEILSMLPMYGTVPRFDANCVAVWRTPAGGFRNAHKDGLQNGCAINLPIDIADNCCITSWYNDDQLSSCVEESKSIYFHGREGGFREAKGFSFDKHRPNISTVMGSNEFILFNSNIWHSIDNRQSPFDRSMITFRFEDSENLTYIDIYRQLFG